MNIKLMLARLESAMGCEDIIEQMVLLPPTASLSQWAEAKESVNLVVGYNRSPSSQTALDVTLWIAHQTRLATQKQVTVQVVYVVDENQNSKHVGTFDFSNGSNRTSDYISLEFSAVCALGATTPALEVRPESPPAHRITSVDPSYFRAVFYQNNQFEQADRILSQARCLAGEWGGSFKAHLRFGCVSQELRRVVESEAADLLFLGCGSANHPVVQQLGSHFPCPVLGIPTILRSIEET